MASPYSFPFRANLCAGGKKNFAITKNVEEERSFPQQCEEHVSNNQMHRRCTKKGTLSTRGGDGPLNDPMRHFPRGQGGEGVGTRRAQDAAMSPMVLC